MWDRPEQTARLLAREIPVDAAFVALIHGPEDAELGARAADAIAAGVSRRREHILLASCEASPAFLDELLGGSEAPGFAAALRGETRLTETAIRREDRLYVYLPAGRRPPPPERVAAEPTLASFVRRVRERGGTLLAFGPDRLLEIEDFVRLLDGYVSLGAVRVPSTGPLPTELARVRFRGEEADEAGPLVRAPEPVPEAGEAEGAPAEDAEAPEGTPEAAEATGGEPDPELEEPVEVASGVWRRSAGKWRDLAGAPGTASDAGRAGPRGSEWRRHRKRPGFPYARVAAGLAIVAALAVGWWVLARTATTADSLGAEPGTAGAESAAVDLQALISAVETAPDLPYSVLIASYAAAADARERVERLRRAEDGLFFIAPTPVRGAIYHRVFAGARSDVADGRRLMGELVEAGRKEAVSDWDVRPAGLSFRLGVFATAAEAGETAAALESRAVPTYVVPAGTGELRAWQVYAGAYESEAAARPLAAILERAGLRAELVTRRGEVR